MQYTKTEATQGAWIKASETEKGTKAKLVSETKPMEGEFGTQDVAKIRIEGESETKNVRLNKPTMNAFIDAYGSESKDWINKPITIQTEEMRVAGKKVTALYFIPEDYQLTEDGNGYLVVIPMDVKKEVPTGEPPEKEEIPVVEDGEEEAKDVPF